MRHFNRLLHLLILASVLCGGCKGVEYYSSQFKKAMVENETYDYDRGIEALLWLQKHGYIKTGVPVSQVRELLGTDIVEQSPEDPTDEMYMYSIAPGLLLHISIENGIVDNVGLGDEEGH